MSDARARGAARVRGFRAALWTLVLLVSSAIYAPLVANGKPYYLRAVDWRALRGAVATLEPLAAEWGARPGDAAALLGVELRLATLERHLAPDHALRASITRARERLHGAAQTGSNSGELVRAVTGELATLVEHARAALPAGDASEPSPWRATSRWPLLESLGVIDWVLALGWPVLVGAMLAGARVRPGRLAWALAAALVLALALERGFEPARALATREFKSALASGELDAQAAWFAPVPYGYDETRLGEALRPPTWLASAELGERGQYVRGPRAEASPPALRPVEVRAGEPALNSPLRHLCGTDALGRDVLARVLWGGRVSLSVAFSALALLMALGVSAGLAAGVARGAVDALFLFVVQTLQSFPSLFLILVASALLPARGVHPQVATALVIAGVGWTGVARLVRAQVRAVRDLDWVNAARGAGLSEARVLWMHIAPNALAPALVSGAFALGGAILAESATSFLGFGIAPPIPSWGAVLRESSAAEHLWILLAPGVLVFAAVAAANALGDELRQRLDLREDEA